MLAVCCCWAEEGRKCNDNRGVWWTGLPSGLKTEIDQAQSRPPLSVDLWDCKAIGYNMNLYPITMATDHISWGNKFHARRVQYQQEVVAVNYNTALCSNRIITQGLSCLSYKLVITHFLELQAKYDYSALPQPHIVLCLPTFPQKWVVATTCSKW